MRSVAALRSASASQELKQKELEELSAVLGELGIDPNVSDQPKEPTEAALKRKKKKERSRLAGNDADDNKVIAAVKETEQEDKDPGADAAPDVRLVWLAPVNCALHLIDASACISQC